MTEEKRQQRRQQRRQQPLRRRTCAEERCAQRRPTDLLRGIFDQCPQPAAAAFASARTTNAKASELAYHEHCLEVEPAFGAPKVAESLANGHSVFVVPSFATPAERHTLIDAANAVVRYRRHSLTGLNEVANETRSWTSSSNVRNLVRLNVAKRLDAASSEISKVLVARALSLLESQFPRAAASIFKLEASVSFRCVLACLSVDGDH